MPAVPNAATRSVRAFFFVLGAAVATWAAIVPFAKARLALDEAALGAVLLAFGGGTIAATVVAPAATRRFGSRATLVGAAVVMSALLPPLVAAPSAAALAATLFAFGIGTGLTGVAVNAQAIAVETRAARPLMSGFHALFSIGGLAGAMLGSVLLRSGVAIDWSVLVLAAGLLVTVARFHRGLVADARPDRGAATAGPAALPTTPVLVVGLMALVLYLAEGAVLDWAAVFLGEHRRAAASTATLGYAAFSLAMAAGRGVGDRVVARHGPVAVVRGGALVAAAGFVLFVVAPLAGLGVLACAVIGLGASNVVPTLISASARVSTTPPAAAVATVAAMGTCGLIAGPAVLGFVAAVTDLTLALAAPAALLLVVAGAARVVRPRPN